MRFVQVLAHSFALLGVAYAASLSSRALSSAEQPVDVPYNIDELTQAAGLAQETYCAKEVHDYGLKVGDATLLWGSGDGNFKQHVNIFHSDMLGIVLAFQGTNTSSLLSDLHDAQFRQVDPNHRYIQYYPRGTKVMHGFQKAYTDLVDRSLAKVKEFKEKKNEKRVTVVGHSLGAAMGLLGAMDVHLRLDGCLHRAFLFGLPRVGNPTFASFVDESIGDKLRWVINGRDWVPLVPPRAFGYQHPSNYVWIWPPNSTNWKMYPGQENVHGVRTIHQEVGWTDHTGIYFHTQIGASSGFCPAKVGNF